MSRTPSEVDGPLLPHPHGVLGHTTKLEKVRYLAKDANGADFLRLHHGERIFYAHPGSPDFRA